MDIKKVAYEANFKYKGAEAYDLFILEVDINASKEQELDVLKDSISKRYRIKPDKLEIYNTYKININNVRIKDLTVEDFSLLFNIAI